MKIRIESIPGEQHRYPTVGDWFYEPDGTLVILVSKMSDERYEQLVAIHELVEVMLCKYNGVSQDSVDRFDMEFEKSRHPDNDDEPGDDNEAPYRREHCFATAVERMMAAEMDVKWNEYADAIEAL